MSTVLGLDLSSTATGICSDLGFLGPPDDWMTSTFKPKGDLLDRARQTRDTVNYALGWPLDAVVIESIGTRFIATAIAMATIHALVLDILKDTYIVPIMVEPKRLKKFATGNGNADKTAMVLAAHKGGWEPPPDADDNQADAWHLWTVGKASLGEWVVPETAYRTESLRLIMEGK